MFATFGRAFQPQAIDGTTDSKPDIQITQMAAACEGNGLKHDMQDLPTSTIDMLSGFKKQLQSAASTVQATFDLVNRLLATVNKLVTSNEDLQRRCDFFEAAIAAQSPPPTAMPDVEQLTHVVEALLSRAQEHLDSEAKFHENGGVLTGLQGVNRLAKTVEALSSKVDIFATSQQKQQHESANVDQFHLVAAFDYLSTAVNQLSKRIDDLGASHHQLQQDIALATIRPRQPEVEQLSKTVEELYLQMECFLLSSPICKKKQPWIEDATLAQSHVPSRAPFSMPPGREFSPTFFSTPQYCMAPESDFGSNTYGQQYSQPIQRPTPRTPQPFQPDVPNSAPSRPATYHQEFPSLKETVSVAPHPLASSKPAAPPASSHGSSDQGESHAPQKRYTGRGSRGRPRNSVLPTGRMGTLPRAQTEWGALDPVETHARLQALGFGSIAEAFQPPFGWRPNPRPVTSHSTLNVLGGVKDTEACLES